MYSSGSLWTTDVVRKLQNEGEARKVDRRLRHVYAKTRDRVGASTVHHTNVSSGLRADLRPRRLPHAMPNKLALHSNTGPDGEKPTVVTLYCAF